MSESIAWNWVFETSLPSACGAGHGVLTELLAALDRNGWTLHEIQGIHLAVEEGLVNAIRHGNQSDHAKQVHVACKVSPAHMVIEITDEGSGFDPEEVPDCTADENLHRPSGRGIMLMRNYMSRVEYLDGGQRVVMEKRRASRTRRRWAFGFTAPMGTRFTSNLFWPARKDCAQSAE